MNRQVRVRFAGRVEIQVLEERSVAPKDVSVEIGPATSVHIAIRFIKGDRRNSTPDDRVIVRGQEGAVLQQDRMVVSFENGILIADWLDPNTRERYGTMVLARCGST